MVKQTKSSLKIKTGHYKPKQGKTNQIIMENWNNASWTKMSKTYQIYHENQNGA